MTEKYESYNPLDYKNLTLNLVRELMSRVPVQMPLQKKFLGPGVYAIFYKGKLPLYAAISSKKLKYPIYVGRAILSGGRKGIKKKDADTPLYERLQQHAASIQAAKNLNIDDFACRYLVVEPLWIEMSEQFLIAHYRPAWNVCVDGFGNKDPGEKRYSGLKPMWDCLHPGRAWSEKMNARDAAPVEKALRDYFATMKFDE